MWLISGAVACFGEVRFGYSALGRNSSFSSAYCEASLVRGIYACTQPPSTSFVIRSHRSVVQSIVSSPNLGKAHMHLSEFCGSVVKFIIDYQLLATA